MMETTGAESEATAKCRRAIRVYADTKHLKLTLAQCGVVLVDLGWRIVMLQLEVVEASRRLTQRSYYC